jgi:hypothetical protein
VSPALSAPRTDTPRVVGMNTSQLLAYCRSRLETVKALYAWAEGQPARCGEAAALGMELVHDLRTLTAAVADGRIEKGTAAARQLEQELEYELDSLSTRLSASEANLQIPISGLAHVLAKLKKETRRGASRTSLFPSGALPSIRWRQLTEAALLLAIALLLLVMLLPAWLYPDRAIRLADFAKLMTALESYRADNGHYPISLSAGGGNEWTGIGWNGVGEDWLPGLVPKYLEKLPRDPRGPGIAQAQYIYFSDGQDYKLLSLSTPECRWTVLMNPAMNDPRRNTEDVCEAYGYYTGGAAQW